MASNFTVVGVVRDSEKKVIRDVTRIRKAINPLGRLSFFIVESDSKDSTKISLEKLKMDIPNFDFVSLGNMENKIPDRIERLIYCRNVYVHEIRSNPQYLASDYIIVMDLDGINNRISYKAIQRSLSRDLDWSGLFANQKYRYYDLLALRHKFWCPGNVFEEYYWLRTIIPARKAKRDTIYRRMIKINKALPLIPVSSAFGGLALYKKKDFVASSYTRTERDEISDIDHVIFNRRITEQGGQLFIDPSLINAYLTRHSLNSFATFRALVKIKTHFGYKSHRTSS